MEVKALTVTELNCAVRNVLENHFHSLLIEGELSNCSRPASGHIYFSLKDAHSQVRCAFFRPKSLSVDFEVKNGLQVRVRARVSLYPSRGDYQLIVEQMLAQGQGDLRQAYDALVKKLKALGWFDTSHKKALPQFARHLGIVTSPTGAAIRDILSVLARRFPGLPVTLYPCLVQGRQASAEIVQAIEYANREGLCDVLIVGRGGGSLEDLWPFNEERVAEAIFQSRIPIISAVGHEVDFTISDLVADVRAPTPSVAAELASPNQIELKEQIEAMSHRLVRHLRQTLDAQAQKLDWLARALRHPGERITAQKLIWAKLKVDLSTAMQASLKQRRQVLELTRRALRDPQAILNAHQLTVQRLAASLEAFMLRRLKTSAERLQQTAHMLDTLSPLGTLKRGYTLTRTPEGTLIKRAAGVVAGETIRVQWVDKSLDCMVLPMRGGDEADR